MVVAANRSNAAARLDDLRGAKRAPCRRRFCYPVRGKARRKEGRAGSKRQHLASWNEKPVEDGAMLAATQWRLSILAALVSPRYNARRITMRVRRTKSFNICFSGALSDWISVSSALKQS
jgi:hypothetical protein